MLTLARPGKSEMAACHAKLLDENLNGKQSNGKIWKLTDYNESTAV